ncbi:MAG: MFS transporter, partial [Thermoflexia bacterium]
MADRSASWSLWRVVFWVSFPFGILSFVLPIYSRELGASAIEVGALFTVMSLGPVVVRPFLGRALDRWGRRPFLILGLGAQVASMLLFTLARTVRTLTLARFIQGWGDAFLWLTAYTVAADLAPEGQRGQEFGLMDEAYYRGAILGSLAGFGILFAFRRAGCSLPETWPWLFALYILSSLVAFWFGWWGVPETRPRACAPVESRPFSGQLLALMGIVFVTGASGMMVWPLLMLFLQDSLGAGMEQLAMAYLPAALIGSFLPSRTGRIADRWGRKGPIIAGLVLGALASGLIPSLRSLFLLALLWLLESVGYCISLPAERAFVADIAGDDTRGTSYGLYTFAYFLGAAVGPLAGG